MEEQHKRFSRYLIGKLDGDKRRAESIVAKAEGELPQVLNAYFSAGVQSIYNLTDSEAIDSYVKMIKLHPLLKNLDMHSEPRYTEVLTWYRRFIKQTTYAAPLPVPGEGDHVAEEAPHKTVVYNTVFVEGEAEERQPAEIRLRNRELREACIAYYKDKHHGHLVCECCGFDFSRAYDISDEYIEVHHLTPISETDGAHEVNAETDLVPLCANCHRMIHHLAPGRGTCVTLEKLQSQYKGKIYKEE